MELQFHPDPAQKLSANLNDIYHCCVYSEKILMMDRRTVRNMQSFNPKNKFEKSVHLVCLITRNFDIYLELFAVFQIVIYLFHNVTRNP